MKSGGVIFCEIFQFRSYNPYLNFLLFFCSQNIILYEYIPILLNEDVPPYVGYKPDLHPGISHIFQSAAFRFGHTLIPPGIYRRDESCEYRRTNTDQAAIRLCSTWWDSNVSESGSFVMKFSTPLQYATYQIDN